MKIEFDPIEAIQADIKQYKNKLAGCNRVSSEKQEQMFKDLKKIVSKQAGRQLELHAYTINLNRFQDGVDRLDERFRYDGLDHQVE